MKVVTQNVLTEPMQNQKEHKNAVMSKRRSESFYDNADKLASCTAKVTEHAEQCETERVLDVNL